MMHRHSPGGMYPLCKRIIGLADVCSFHPCMPDQHICGAMGIHLQISSPHQELCSLVIVLLLYRIVLLLYYIVFMYCMYLNIPVRRVIMYYHILCGQIHIWASAGCSSHSVSSLPMEEVTCCDITSYWVFNKTACEGVGKPDITGS